MSAWLLLIFIAQDYLLHSGGTIPFYLSLTTANGAAELEGGVRSIPEQWAEPRLSELDEADNLAKPLGDDLLHLPVSRDCTC